MIQDLGLFKKDDEVEETVNSSTVKTMFNEPPDVTEIKAVLKQASQDIRIANKLPSVETELSSEGIMREISKDLGRNSSVCINGNWRKAMKSIDLLEN